MNDLRDFLMWLVVTMVATGLVGAHLEVLVLISGEVAGVLAGVFLSLCLGSLLLLTVPVIYHYLLSRFCQSRICDVANKPGNKKNLLSTWNRLAFGRNQ